MVQLDRQGENIQGVLPQLLPGRRLEEFLDRVRAGQVTQQPDQPGQFRRDSGDAKFLGHQALDKRAGFGGKTQGRAQAGAEAQQGLKGPAHK